MGNKNSSELQQLPLQAQAKPFRMSDVDFVSERPTAFRIKTHTFSSGMEVFDQRNGILVYEIKSKVLSSRINLTGSDGHTVMSVKSKTLSSDYRVYERDETDNASFTIGVKKPVTSPSVVFIEFPDRVTGHSCRVIVESNFSDHVAVVYLERSRSSLSRLEKQDSHDGAQYQAIGRFHRPTMGNEESIEVAAGVDATVLVLLWLVRHNEVQQTSTGATGAILVAGS